MRGKTWLARMTRAPTCEKSRSVVEMHAASFELRKQSLLVLLQSSQHELPYWAMLDYGGAPMWRPQPILFFPSLCSLSFSWFPHLILSKITKWAIIYFNFKLDLHYFD